MEEILQSTRLTFKVNENRCFNELSITSYLTNINSLVEHGPPVNATLTVQSPTSIHVEWSPPISSLASLFTYTVFYSGDPFDTSMKSVTTGPSTTRVLLINLTPYTQYSVYITAVTHFDSNQTEILTARTLQQGEFLKYSLLQNRVYLRRQYAEMYLKLWLGKYYFV